MKSSCKHYVCGRIFRSVEIVIWYVAMSGVIMKLYPEMMILSAVLDGKTIWIPVLLRYIVEEF